MAERLNCKSTEAVVSASNGYISVRGGGTGVLLAEGQEVHFQGDKRDAVNRGGKLVWLDGPVGSTGGPCPNCAAKDAKLADLKAKLQAIVAGL